MYFRSVYELEFKLNFLIFRAHHTTKSEIDVFRKSSLGVDKVVLFEKPDLALRLVVGDLKSLIVGNLFGFGVYPEVTVLATRYTIDMTLAAIGVLIIEL